MVMFHDGHPVHHMHNIIYSQYVHDVDGLCIILSTSIIVYSQMDKSRESDRRSLKITMIIY